MNSIEIGEDASKSPLSPVEGVSAPTSKLPDLSQHDDETNQSVPANSSINQNRTINDITNDMERHGLYLQ